MMNDLVKKLMCLVVVLGAFFFVSCSEEDNTVEEYADWQRVNETYFDNLTDSVKTLVAAGRTDWKRIKCWSKSDDTEGVNSDYIIVEVLKDADATATACPLYTDTVSVHYQGRLLSSPSHKYGFVFDQSYYGDFNEDLCSPMSFAVNGVVPGFSTALQYMNRGDKWRVYMPYQLAYGTTDQSTIPGYSTLIFDITLVDFWSAKYSD